MASKLTTRRVAALAGTMVLAGPVVAACIPGEPTFDEWAETDGAAGRINLDEVQEAFKKSESPSEFERRVNEIYEGDSLLLIRVSESDGVKTLEAFEDLDGNGEIDDARDDRLFSLTSGRENELRGHGANGYYRSSFGGGNFLFTYLLISSLSRGPYLYQTPRGTVSNMKRSRGNYRNSSGYGKQVSKNGKFFSNQKKFAGSNFDSAGRNISTSRQSYQSRQRSSGAFKRSSTGVRSSWGARSGGRGGGRFGGFGGAQVVIGLRRG